MAIPNITDHIESNQIYRLEKAQQVAIIELYKKLSKQPDLDVNEFLKENKEIIENYIFYQLSLQWAMLQNNHQLLKDNMGYLAKSINIPLDFLADHEKLKPKT